MKHKNIPTSYSHALEILNGKMRKTIHGIRGTHLEVGDHGVVMYYHNTAVVYFNADGSIRINSGGYRTRTTKTKINQALDNRAKVYQHRGDWYLYYPEGNTSHPFTDKMGV